MKIKVFPNKNFVLSVENTQKVIDTYIKPYYSAYVFTITKSSQSCSIYVHIEYDGLKSTARLSDHPSPSLMYHYICPKTKTSKVVSIIVNTIDRMHNHRLNEILGI